MAHLVFLLAGVSECLSSQSQTINTTGTGHLFSFVLMEFVRLYTYIYIYIYVYNHRMNINNYI